MKTSIKKTLVAYSFIAPSLVGLFLFTLLPVLISLAASFSRWQFVMGLKGFTFVGLKNFVRLLSDGVFWKSVSNNLIMLVGIPITMLIALILASVVDKHVYGKRLVRLLIYIPHLTSAVVVAYVWKSMLSANGAVNGVLGAIFGREMPVWFFDPVWSLPVIILVGIWSSLGYVFVIYTAGLQNIPDSMYEAADVEGARGYQKFLHITIPLLAPTTFFLLITQIIFSFRAFAPIYILTQGGPGLATTVSAYHIYITAFQYYDMGYSASMTWVIFVLLFVFTLIQWRAQNRMTHQ